MDFSWTTGQEDLYMRTLSQVQNKLTAEDTDLSQERHKPPTYWTRKQWLTCGDLNLLGLSVPMGYGGCGYDALTTSRAIEAFGRGCEDMGLVFSVSAHLFACAMPIAEYGNEALKARILPGLCSGRLIGANAITEDNAGSDVFRLKNSCSARGGFLCAGWSEKLCDQWPCR